MFNYFDYILLTDKIKLFILIYTYLYLYSYVYIYAYIHIYLYTYILIYIYYINKYATSETNFFSLLKLPSINSSRISSFSSASIV